MLRKAEITFEVVNIRKLNYSTCLLRLKPVDNRSLPEMCPGQFVNVRVQGPDIFLRRPISICYYDHLHNELWLMVKNVGKGSKILFESRKGQIFDILLPLGNGFLLPDSAKRKILLIGGGVGIAPIYYLARWMKLLGIDFEILIGSRTADELLFLDELSALTNVHVTTDDGSAGEKGFVVNHSCLNSNWSDFYVCGPLPMMKSVAKLASSKEINCQVSLENHMACGIGACLCCVEDTKEGNICVCTDGPVFNINQLKW